MTTSPRQNPHHAATEGAHSVSACPDASRDGAGAQEGAVRQEIPVLVEFDEAGRPFHVVTDGNSYGATSFYQIEWCKRDQRLYSHLCGSGGAPYIEGRGPWWAAEGVELAGDARSELRLPTLPPAWSAEKLLALLGEWSEETHYCPLCDDWLPGDRDELCAHVWWCEECGWWVGPGTDDPCEHRNGAAA